MPPKQLKGRDNSSPPPAGGPRAPLPTYGYQAPPLPPGTALKPWDAAFKNAAAKTTKRRLRCPSCSNVGFNSAGMCSDKIYSSLKCRDCGRRMTSNSKVFYATYETSWDELLKSSDFNFADYERRRPTAATAPATIKPTSDNAGPLYTEASGGKSFSVHQGKRLRADDTGGCSQGAKGPDMDSDPVFDSGSGWSSDQEDDILRAMVEKEFKMICPRRTELPSMGSMMAQVLQDLLEKSASHKEEVEELKDSLEAILAQLASLKVAHQESPSTGDTRAGTGHASSNIINGANININNMNFGTKTNNSIRTGPATGASTNTTNTNAIRTMDTSITNTTHTRVNNTMNANVARTKGTTVANTMNANVAGTKNTTVANTMNANVAGTMNTNVASTMNANVDRTMNTNVTNTMNAGITGAMNTNVANTMNAGITGAMNTNVANTMNADITRTTNTSASNAMHVDSSETAMSSPSPFEQPSTRPLAFNTLNPPHNPPPHSSLTPPLDQDGFITVNRAKRKIHQDEPHGPRYALSGRQMERVANGLPGSSRETETLFVRGWKETGRYSLLRNFFEGLDIPSSWIREMTWNSAETLQMIVQEAHADEVRSKIRGHGSIFIDESYNWHKAATNKGVKHIEDTIKGIDRRLERLSGQFIPVGMTLTSQSVELKAHLSDLPMQEQTKALAQSPGSRDRGQPK